MPIFYQVGVCVCVWLLSAHMFWSSWLASSSALFGFPVCVRVPLSQCFSLACAYSGVSFASPSRPPSEAPTCQRSNKWTCGKRLLIIRLSSPFPLSFSLSSALLSSTFNPFLRSFPVKFAHQSNSAQSSLLEPKS